MITSVARLQRAAACSRLSHRRTLNIGSSSRSISAVAGFDFVSSILGKRTTSIGEVKTNGILDWARQASVGTELAPKEAPEGYELGTFAGGCFWGLELAMQRVPGVIKTSVGYTAGDVPNPTYEVVCSGRSGHTEAVQVVYDPNVTTFGTLLEVFADKIDLTTLNRQGSDRGTQYRSGVYYHTDEQRATAEAFYKQLNEEIAAGKRGNWAGREVVAELEPVGDYYIAEKYHQQYLAKGGRFGMAQSAEKGCTDKIRCYG